MFKRFIPIALFLSLSLVAKEPGSIIVCENSLETFEWQIDFIKEAKQTIELSACFTGGSIFRALLEAIGKRIEACPNLQAYVLASPVLLEQRERDMIAEYDKKYAGQLHLILTDAIFIQDPTYSGIENHFKTIIVDETYYCVGGTNLDEVVCVEGTTTPPRRPGEGVARNTSPAGMRDQDVVGRSREIAKDLRVVFHKLYRLWEAYFKCEHFERDLEVFGPSSHYKPVNFNEVTAVCPRFEKSPILRGVGDARIVYSGPYQEKNAISAEYVRLFSEAKKEVTFGNMYVNFQGPVFPAVKEAIKRGVEFTVITNGPWSQSPMFAQFFGWSNRMHYVPLFYGREFNFWESWTAEDEPLYKTRIFEYRVPDVMYHKKTSVFDRKTVFIGSYNFGIRSHKGDYELNILIESKAVAEDVLKVLKRDTTFCEEITPEVALKWYFDPLMAYWGRVQMLFNGFM